MQSNPRFPADGQGTKGKRLIASPVVGVGAGTLALSLDDGWADDDEVGFAERWRAPVLACVAGLVACITFVATVALLDRLN